MGHRQMVFLQRLVIAVPRFTVLSVGNGPFAKSIASVYKYTMCVCTPEQYTVGSELNNTLSVFST